MDSRRETLCGHKASRRCIGKSVSAALQRMSVVAPEPLPTNAKLYIQIDEPHPEVLMVEWQTTPVSPPLVTPLKDKASHPVNQEFGIGMQLNSCSVWNRTQSLDRREKFHLGDRDPGKCARHLATFVPLNQDCTPSTGAWVADRRAVREDANEICHLGSS